MKKLTLILAAQLIGTVAMASTSLTVETTNGTVAPQYQVKTTCTITQDGFVNTPNSGGFAQGGHPIHSAQFTHDVPSPGVMVQLAKEALSATLAPTGARAPIGGGVSNFSVTVGKKTTNIRTLAVASIVTYDTNNESAKKLADFMKKNCL